jgi:formamidopyrimidine-DNA glycosylase
MPELPEIEVLVRHLRPLLLQKTVVHVEVRRTKVIRPMSVHAFSRKAAGATFIGLSRRGKYLVFELESPKASQRLTLLGHLGMTGRMFLSAKEAPLPRHTAVVMDLGRETFVFEDTRYFGRMTFDLCLIEKLGPEPLDAGFTADLLFQRLKRSRQCLKVKLLDQSLVAGLGNIYASEALFRARLGPKGRSWKITSAEAKRLWRAIRQVLSEAIRFGSTVPLSYAGLNTQNRLFYYGRSPEAEDFYEERLRVYDRAGEQCLACGEVIKRIVQAGRSTFFCPRCQRK